MNNTMNAAEVMLDTLSAVMGDYAPRKRRLLLDFKDDHGQDRNMDAIVWHNPKTTDETVVRMLKEQLCSDGGRLSAISEVLEDGTGYCLYRNITDVYAHANASGGGGLGEGTTIKAYGLR